MKVITTVSFCLLLTSAVFTARGLSRSTNIRSQFNTIDFPSNIIAEGIPRIPISIVNGVREYGSVDGTRFIGWNNPEARILTKTLKMAGWEIASESGSQNERTVLATVPAGTYEIYPRPNQSTLLAYTADTNGNEAFQVYTFNTETRKTSLISDGKSRNTEPCWSHSGERIVYSSNRRNGKDIDLYMASISDPEKSTKPLVEVTGGYLICNDFSPDDRQLTYVNWVSRGEVYVWTVNVETGERKLLNPADKYKKSYYDAPLFSKDGKGIYVITNYGADTKHLVYIDLRSNKFTNLTPGINHDVDEASLSPDGKYLSFIVNEDGASKLYFLSTATGKVKGVGLSDFQGAGIITRLRWAKDSNDLAFVYESPQIPKNVYSLNINSNKIKQWTSRGISSDNKQKFPPAELIKWPSFDGKTITGFIYRPPSAKYPGKRPVIIDLHGGPDEQFRPEFLGETGYFTNELGVAKIFPNVRGSTGFGRSFEQEDNGQKRENSTKDVGALLDWIKNQPDLDASRVMIMGASYGGYLSLSCAVKYGDRLRGVVSTSGITSLVSFLENTADWRRELKRVEYGDERDPTIRKYLESISPLNNAEKVKIPLLIVHGQNDQRVPYTEAENIVKAVHKNGIPVWFLLIKDEGHEFSQSGNYAYELYTSINFIKEYLLK